MLYLYKIMGWIDIFILLYLSIFPFKIIYSILLCLSTLLFFKYRFYTFLLDFSIVFNIFACSCECDSLHFIFFLLLYLGMLLNFLLVHFITSLIIELISSSHFSWYVFPFLAAIYPFVFTLSLITLPGLSRIILI